MLVTNQFLDKLTASRQDFYARGMLNSTCLSSVLAALNTEAPREHRDADQCEPPVLPATGEDENNDIDIIDDPTSVLAHVELAKTPRKYTFINSHSIN